MEPKNVLLWVTTDDVGIVLRIEEEIDEEVVIVAVKHDLAVEKTVNHGIPGNVVKDN